MELSNTELAGNIDHRACGQHRSPQGVLRSHIPDPQAGVTYTALVADEVTAPLSMHDTVAHLSAEQQTRFIQGHSDTGEPTGGWDIDALAGAGALRSTAADMLIYLEANLQPEKLNVRSRNASTLAQAIAQSHELRADAGPDTQIAFAWLCDSQTGNYWHNGGTGGYTAYAFFNPKGNYAGVVLVNTGPDPRGSFADRRANSGSPPGRCHRDSSRRAVLVMHTRQVVPAGLRPRRLWPLAGSRLAA